MNRARPVKITKIRQVRAAAAQSKPGLPHNGPNLVAQRAASTKKNARKSSQARQSKAGKQA